MSRSNPHEQGSPNPAVRWFEWNGEKGNVRYYDKDQKKTIELDGEFSFVLLDQLGSVRGWHEATESGIYSNEVKDTRQDVMVVKAHKGGTLAEGIYKAIKETAYAVGGQFTANCYIAFKKDGTLALGSLRLKGAALSAWMDFCRQHRSDIYDKGIVITGYTEGKKGRVTFRVPVFKMKPVSTETNANAMALDVTLQAWLDGYLKRNKREQVEMAARGDHLSDEEMPSTPAPAPITEDDIPF